MDSVALILDVEEVRRHGQPYNGNEVIYGDLPCYEVGGFGHFRHSPSRPVCSVKDWPIIWAVAIIDEAYDQFCFHDGFATLCEAQSEAHRLATNLLHEQGSRRNFLRRRYGPNVLGADAFGMAHDPYVRFEALLKQALPLLLSGMEQRRSPKTLLSFSTDLPLKNCSCSRGSSRA